MKKKIILTKKQLINLCEGYDDTSATKLNYIANDEKDITNVGVDAFNKISDNGGKNIQLTVNTPNSTPQDNVNITGIGNTPQEQLNNAIEQADNSGINTDDVNFNLNIDGNGELVKTNESKIYTKKQIQEARVKLIKENKNIFTKQQLQEAFIGDLSAQQIKNMTGIQDDDELNASIATENRENILSNICKDIALTDKQKNVFKGVYKFIDIINIMKKHGFKYMGANEDEQAHIFNDGSNEIIIWPKYFYVRQGGITIHNINIYENKLNENKINESSNSYLKKKYINFIYNSLKNDLNKMYKDDDWGAVSMIYQKLKTILNDKGDVEMRVENGGYWKRMGEFPNYKEYKIIITLNEGIIINGSLKCHAAGTIEDTFKYYDITLTMW